MALSYIQEKHEEMVVSARVCVQLSTGKMYWYNVLQFIYHCMKEITSWRLTEFTSLLIRCLRPAAEFPLIFTPAPSLFPLLLLASSYSAVMEGHRWSDHTLHVREPVNCHYSWIDCSENQASGLHVHQEEDREDPRGADFKAISCLGWNQNWEISEMLSRKATGHMCVCECIMYCMSETFHRGMTGAKSYQSELKSFEIFDPLNVPVFTLLYVSDAGTQTFLFWNLQCKYESGTTRL